MKTKVVKKVTKPKSIHRHVIKHKRSTKGIKRILQVGNRKETVEIINPNDWYDHFYRHNYIVLVTEQGIPFGVNAANEQEAIDEIIDYCEENYKGLVSTYNELIDDGYTDTEIDDFTTYGGNHGVYLNTPHILFYEYDMKTKNIRKRKIVKSHKTKPKPKKPAKQIRNREKPLLVCGHTALGHLPNGDPICPICGTTKVITAKPSIEGRSARCTCGKISKSSYSLPFFRIRPNEKYDDYYCGCRGWD